MSRAAGPLWTAEPSRFAEWPRARARLRLGGLGLWLLAAGNLPVGDEGAGDPALYAGAVEAMRHGGEYYPLVADALRSGGHAAGRLAFPPPTLAVVAAVVPGWAVTALLSALAVGVLVAWRPVLNGALTRPAARWGASLLLVAGLVPYLLPSMPHVPEAWAGLLLALSLARWARGAWVEAVAFGSAAAVVREAAAVYLLVMLLFAVGNGARREALGWGAALGASALAAASHWRAVRHLMGPLTGAEAADSGGLAPLIEASPFGSLPAAAPLVVLALAAFGWIAWRGEAGLRLVATLAAVAVLALARPEIGGDWGYLVAAPLLAGLAFAPDGVRDLLRGGGTTRRRITVTRVVR